MYIAVSSWSLRAHVNKDFPLYQMAKFVKDKYGVDAVELCSMHFWNMDTRYLDEIKKGLEEAGSKVVNMPVDTGNISNRDEQKRKFDLNVIKLWMDVAKYIGSPSIRVNTGMQEPPYDLSITADSYKELAQYGEKIGIKVLLENHGGLSADPDNIVNLFESVNSPYFRSCPDFGNFAPDIRYDGLDKIAKYAVIAHAKTYDFDEDGEVPQFDFKKCLDILKKNGFDGCLSVEFEGRGDQYEGVQKTIDLIKKYW